MMNDVQQGKYYNKILTVPNVLSFFRLALIPVIIWLYIAMGEYVLTAGLIVLSGATDVIDGFIARRFNMVSALGKALDPVADKLTQCAMLICLVFRFPLMLLPLGLLVVKELFSGITGLVIIKQSGKVYSALWHGKATTVLLYVLLLTHVLWTTIPQALSEVMILATLSMMIISFILYGTRNLALIKAAKTGVNEVV
ncbi:MAG: CDP-alcohol phosphatidyltransferase family protein [Lachnospiraceae bacterium]|nr:CDP-alcohol phosphatidyltransferase family protein [Lachnospiraceae bacterium]MBR5760736.1 CDP-alcohol phosphatidyltransferase family protein [Lachnospiraceae bacterium]